MVSNAVNMTSAAPMDAIATLEEYVQSQRSQPALVNQPSFIEQPEQPVVNHWLLNRSSSQKTQQSINARPWRLQQRQQ